MILKGVAFDMDGTIGNTEILSSMAYCEVLESYGVTPTLGLNGCVHQVGIIGNMIKLREQYGLTHVPLQVMRRKFQKARKRLFAQGVQPMPGIVELVMRLARLRIPMIIASGSDHEDITTVITQLRIAKRFCCLISSSEVGNHKPAPDIYIEGVCRLGINPENCLVIEDSRTGMLAGRGAGCKTIVVPNDYTVREDFTEANAVVRSASNVTMRLIKSL